MRTKELLMTLSLLMAVPVVGFAQSTTGRYATHNGEASTETMADGTMVQTATYSQITFAADKSHPLDNSSSDCTGRFHLSAKGKLMSGSGSCTSTDAEGNTASWWWRVDKIATADCADACGSWGYFAGTGKFKDVKGTGTWIRDTLFPNGSSGTWAGTATIK